ncbi:MAG: aquaporin [Actinomycetota bacterium]
MNRRRLVAELVGTAFLLIAIVGSGIATSAGGAGSAQLFQHAVVVGVALAALIVALGPVSGGHFNPAVTIVDAAFGGIGRRQAVGYVIVQLIGAVLGVAVANRIFGEPVLELAGTQRVGVEMAASEVVATLGLLLVIFGTARSARPQAVPAAVGAYITAAIFFTSSAAFANPAVTVGRVFTDTWTGIAPAGVPGFLAGQAVGTALAVALVAFLFHPSRAQAQEIVVPHEGNRREESDHAG